MTRISDISIGIQQLKCRIRCIPQANVTHVDKVLSTFATAIQLRQMDGTT